MKKILKKWFTLIEMTVIITVVSFLAVYWIRLNTQSEETMKWYDEAFANKRIQSIINREIWLVANYKLDRSELSFTKDSWKYLLNRQRNELVKKVSWEVFSIEEVPMTEWFKLWKVTWVVLWDSSLNDFWWIFEEEFDNLQVIISREWWIVYLWDWVNLSDVKVYLRTDFTPQLIFDRQILVWETKNIEIANCSESWISLSVKDRDVATVYFDEMENTFKITWISTWKTRIINSWSCNVQSSNLIIEVG